MAGNVGLRFLLNFLSILVLAPSPGDVSFPLSIVILYGTFASDKTKIQQRAGRAVFKSKSDYPEKI